jgi:hypothetical protein
MKIVPQQQSVAQFARCYQFTREESRAWDQGGWLSLELEDDAVEWTQKWNIHEPVIVVTHDHRIAFALTEKGVRA